MPYKDPAKRKQYHKAYSAKYYQKHKRKFARRRRRDKKLHPERFTQYSRKSHNKNKKHCSVYNSTWFKKNPEKAKKYWAKRKRNLGFNTLNEWFYGSEGHHINKVDVIYIPKKIHRSIYHNLRTGYNMDKINELAIKFLNQSKA